MAASTKWRKILYEDQGVPDNYVDESFLFELKKNLYVRDYKYWPVVLESGVVTQQISSVCLFVVSFIYMEGKRLAPELLFLIASIATAVGYIVNHFLVRRQHQDIPIRTKLEDLQTAAMFIGFSFGLSPVLLSLTETISTDTIYAMTTVMLLANILFHDYGTNPAIASGPFSFNAAIFASVCLASRLDTTWHAFSMVTFALDLFALWPVLRKRLKEFIPRSQYFMTITLGIMATAALLSVSLPAAGLFVIIHLFINFICPLLLISLQPYKNNIYGPWDEAVIRD